jgi:penicillin amidase
MRYVKLGVAVLLSVIVVAVLATPLGPLPALGPLLSPVGGFWSAAGGGSFASAENLRFPGLQAKVTVLLDRYGIPHVFAGNDRDAAFALGYLQARERLVQMDLQRRQAAGTLAALVGSSALEGDEFMRDVGLRRAAQAGLAAMKPDDPVLLALQAYADGVNAYIKSIEPNDLPLEYKLLGIKRVEPWSVLDELTFAKYMGWDLTNSFDDLYFTTLVEKMGADKVAELFPLNRPGEKPFIPTWPPNEMPLASTALPSLNSQAPSAPVRGSPGLDAAIASVLSRAAAAGQLNSPQEWRGSNNWALGSGRSATGMPIFASDPHLGYQLPSLWYAAQIVTPSQNVTGALLAGVPFVVIGHTRNIAWGLTNTQADVIDFFTEKTNPQNPDQYWHDNKWYEMQVVDEVIEVRGAAPVHYQVRITDHGPIISKSGFEVALQWTGAQVTNEPRALYQLNHAEDHAAYVEALRSFQVPPQNIAYADSRGNIGIWSAGLYPIRKSGDGRTVADGSTGAQDWVGFVPFEQEPHALNPDQGYIESANERVAPPEYPYYIGWQWDPNSRAMRIRQRLDACNPCTVTDMQALQYDSKDVYAEDLLPIMISAVKPQDHFARAALDQMKGWDYFMTTDSVAATIWSRWLEDFRRATWQDDWSTAGFEFNPDGSLKDWDAWGFNGVNEYQPPIEYWMSLVETQPESQYFDDLTTKDKVETRDSLIQASFDQALAELKKELGPDPSGWTYGSHHVLKVPHLIDVAPLNRGGEPIPGDSYSPNGQSNFGPSDGGPSWRMVVDFSNLNASFGVYPGGQSGWPLSTHYDDLIPLWVKGDYFPLLFPAAPEQLASDQVESTLTMGPK